MDHDFYRLKLIYSLLFPMILVNGQSRDFSSIRATVRGGSVPSGGLERSWAHQNRVTLEKLKLCSRKAGTSALPLSDVTASAGAV